MNNLNRQLQAGKAPRCFYKAGEQRISFGVTASPTQGVLTLMGTEVENIQRTHSRVPAEGRMSRFIEGEEVPIPWSNCFAFPRES
jgi:hypothetical protein